jgi:preprotein translocase subunit SecF
MTAPTSRTSSRDQRPIGRNAILRLYRGQTHYDFINRWRYWFAISGTIIIIGMVALGVKGLNFSIDFKGGVVWQVPTTATVAEVRADLSKIDPILGQAQITQLTNRATGQTSIQVQAAGDITGKTTEINAVTDELARIAKVPTDEVSLNAIGPSWGSDITSKAVEAVVVFLVLISISIAIYFETKMAIAALVALLHDMLITVGIYALSGFQVSPDTVIAFLTVLGYSIYDTIVVFDKVKENTVGLASTNRVTYTDVVNLSMNQVLARSINTSFVAVMPVFCILFVGSWILGASALNDFGLALFIGLLSGAYSSIFIASPVLALLKEREPRYVEIRRRLAAYPQSRQVLTPDSVAGGALIASRSVSSVSLAASGSSRSGKPNGGTATGGSTTVAEAPDAAPQVALAATAPPAVAVGPSGQPDSEDLGNGDLGNGDLANDAPGSGGPEGAGKVVGAEVAEIAVASEIEVARATGSEPGAKAGAGARSGTSSGNGARRAPPRPRKKTPRRR